MFWGKETRRKLNLIAFYRSAIKGKDDIIFDSALNSLRLDPSLHQLLPYFTQFISDEVYATPASLTPCAIILRIH